MDVKTDTAILLGRASKGRPIGIIYGKHFIQFGRTSFSVVSPAQAFCHLSYLHWLQETFHYFQASCFGGHIPWQSLVASVEYPWEPLLWRWRNSWKPLWEILRVGSYPVSNGFVSLPRCYKISICSCHKIMIDNKAPPASLTIQDQKTCLPVWSYCHWWIWSWDWTQGEIPWTCLRSRKPPEVSCSWACSCTKTWWEFSRNLESRFTQDYRYISHC